MRVDLAKLNPPRTSAAGGAKHRPTKTRALPVAQSSRLEYQRPEVVSSMGDATTSSAKPARDGIDFPLWMVGRIDIYAARCGVTRQDVIKMWLADRLGL